MSKVRRWEDLPREDLKKIPYYRILGWIPQFHDKDIRAGRTTPDNVPHEAVSYKKKNTRIWLAGKVIQNTTVMVWMAADLVDGYWRNHRQYGTLDKAIEIEIYSIPFYEPFTTFYDIVAMDEKVKEPIIDVLRPHNCDGDLEYGKCEVCGNEEYLQRKYWYYPIKCECCSPTHFEMVRYCKNCTPKEPYITNPTVKSGDETFKLQLLTSILIKIKTQDE